MIRTVAELLSGILRRELPRLDASEITHAPTIGDMYEGLSADLLGRAIPDGLGLQVVTGFATDGVGNLSGQLDCMIVRGEGKKIPYTPAFVWHVKDIIAVIEVKKTVHSEEMLDAIRQLKSVKDLEYNYRETWGPDEPKHQPDGSAAMIAFAQTTRKIAPPYEQLDTLTISEQLIYHTLMIEQYSIIRVVLGHHGFASERNFRRALVDVLKANIGTRGFGPGYLPQIIISGNYSLLKMNGHPLLGATC